MALKANINLDILNYLHIYTLKCTILSYLFWLFMEFLHLPSSKCLSTCIHQVQAVTILLSGFSQVYVLYRVNNHIPAAFVLCLWKSIHLVLKAPVYILIILFYSFFTFILKQLILTCFQTYKNTLNKNLPFHRKVTFHS